jgi:purine-binding chemotaxis protein CheW
MSSASSPGCCAFVDLSLVTNATLARNACECLSLLRDSEPIRRFGSPPPNRRFHTPWGLRAWLPSLGTRTRCGVLLLSRVAETIAGSMQSGERSFGLLVHVGARGCFLPLSEVVETMRPQPVEPLAGVPPFIIGVSIVRGAAVPVVDLGAVVGTTDLRSSSRFVTVRLGDRIAALAVDDVVGVRDLERARMEEMPPLLRGANADVVQAIGTLDAQLLVVLRSSRILPEEVWDALAKREGRS